MLSWLSKHVYAFLALRRIYITSRKTFLNSWGWGGMYITSTPSPYEWREAYGGGGGALITANTCSNNNMYFIKGVDGSKYPETCTVIDILQKLAVLEKTP